MFPSAGVRLLSLYKYDQELGEAIEIEYLRFVPFMNKALARIVQEEHPQYANDAEDQVQCLHPNLENSVNTGCTERIRVIS